MGQSSEHIVGRFQKYFAKREVTFGAFVKPVATDAFKARQHTFTPSKDRIDRDDVRQTRDLLERTDGLEMATWAFPDNLLLPSGVLGTPPDAGPFFETALGTETIDPGVSVIYSLSAQQDLGSLSLVAHDGQNDAWQEVVHGASVNALSFNIDGANRPTWSVEGSAVRYRATGKLATVNGAHAGVALINVTALNQDAVDVGTVVQFNAEDNGGAGYEVTAQDRAANTITITPVLANPLVGGETIKGFAPAETTAGSPVPGVLGSFLVDALGFPITAAVVNISNEIALIDNEAGQTNPTDYIPGPDRVIGGTLNIRPTADQSAILGNRKNFPDRAIVLTMGSIAGNKVEISMPQCEFDMSEVAIPDAPEATMTIPFRAKGTGTENALTLKYF